MKNHTKIISVLLSLIMALSVFTAVPLTAGAVGTQSVSSQSASTADTSDIITGTTGDCTWKIEGTKLTISGNGRMGSYDYDAPWRYSGITEVVIEDGVTMIGKHAFYGCGKLTKISIPDTVTGIGISAFSVSGLTSVTIPDSVTIIGNSAFYGCKSLTNVTIGNSVASIGSDAFEGCTSLTSITIPESVTSIGDFAFQKCTSLTSVTIPDSVTIIGNSAFYGCKSLTNVTIGNSVASIGSVAFEGCTSLTSITIPESVTSIGDFAFQKCTSLTSVTIPDSVTRIGVYAFYGCEKLKSVKIPSSVKSILAKAFGYYNDIDFGTELKVSSFTIYGHAGSEAERYANDNGFKFVSADTATPDEATPDEATPDQKTVTVSGSITSYLDNSDVTVKLSGGDFTAEVKGKADYSIADVPAGEYTLTVAKANHVTREYEITIGEEDLTEDVEINPIGDVNGDGEITQADSLAAIRQVRLIKDITDKYQLKCADINGDGEITQTDALAILRHVRLIKSLY